MRKLKHHEIPRLDPETLKELPRHPLVFVLDNLRSLYNVGSIFRTADAFRVAHIYLLGITPTPEHPGIHKTALGAQYTVPWSHVEDEEALLDGLKAEGYTLAALEITDRPTYLHALEAHHFPLALIIGHEVEGVRDRLVARADLALEIPQFGTKHSLNAAVAAGIAAYRIVEQYYRLIHGTPPIPDAGHRISPQP